MVKTLALVSFIHYAMSATTAHRFAEYHALGDRPRLSAYVAHAIKWTFWPSLAATVLLLALGKPLLWLFGPQFVVGYDIMFIAAIGLVVRSAIGPVERLLNMLGHQHICALAYALAFVMNVVLCVALVPRFGGHGAAAATSISLAFETVLLFWIVRQRLGLHVLAFGKRAARRAELLSAPPLLSTQRPPTLIQVNISFRHFTFQWELQMRLCRRQSWRKPPLPTWNDDIRRSKARSSMPCATARWTIRRLPISNTAS